jgi:hypothetical protein
MCSLKLLLATGCNSKAAFFFDKPKLLLIWLRAGAIAAAVNPKNKLVN